MEIIKKWIPYVICIFLLLVLANDCVNDGAKKIETENNILERQYQTKLKQLESSKKETEKIVDSLHVLNDKKDEEVLILKQNNSVLSDKISVLSLSRQKELKQIKDFTYEQSAEYIAKTYQAPRSVSFNDKGITVTDSLPNLIVRDIAENVYLSQELNLTKGVVFNLERQTELLGEKIKNKDLEIKTVNDLSSQKDSVITSANDLIGGQKKELKKIKTNRTWERILIGVGIVGGIILIK